MFRSGVVFGAVVHRSTVLRNPGVLGVIEAHGCRSNGIVHVGWSERCPLWMCISPYPCAFVWRNVVFFDVFRQIGRRLGASAVTVVHFSLSSPNREAGRMLGPPKATMGRARPNISRAKVTCANCSTPLRTTNHAQHDDRGASECKVVSASQELRRHQASRATPVSGPPLST